MCMPGPEWGTCSSGPHLSVTRALKSQKKSTSAAGVKLALVESFLVLPAFAFISFDLKISPVFTSEAGTFNTCRINLLGWKQ